MSSLLLRGGLVFDGAGSAPFLADVWIENGRIREVGACSGVKADRVLDCRGAWVCPGFIDPHRHIDAAVLREEGYGEVELRQGVTSAIGGNCGLSLAPCPAEYAEAQRAYLKPILGTLDALPVFDSFPAFLDAAEAARPSLNTGFFIGDGTARTAALGFAAPERFPEEALRRAESYIDEALRAGAFGLTLGLMYVPEAHYTFDELAACMRVAAQYGAPVPAHIRGEGELLAESVRELIALGKASGARVGISHFKAAGPLSWGAVFDDALASLAAARAEGQSVTADAYPYTAGSTTLLSLLPPDWQQDGADALSARLAVPEQRLLLREILAVRHEDWDNQLANRGWEDTILISAAGTEANRRWIGKYVGEIAREMGLHPVDAMCELLVPEPQGISIVTFSMDPKNVRRVFALPDTMCISDSVLPDGPKHPRYRGAFPRFLREYALGEDPLFAPEEAIRRMTGLTASVYGLRSKGFLRAGYDADVAVIEPDSFRDRADYLRPDPLAEGARFVLVNGSVAVENDRLVSRGLGRVLRRGVK